jgi:hypothetical protein
MFPKVNCIVSPCLTARFAGENVRPALIIVQVLVKPTKVETANNTLSRIFFMKYDFEFPIYL